MKRIKGLSESVRVYDSGFRGSCPPEEIEQINSVSWFRHNYPQYQYLFFHPVNEGKIPVHYRAKLKKCGMLSGMSDCVLLVRTDLHPYALIELKRQDRTKSRISDDQKLVLNAAAEMGAFAAVACGFDEFKKSVDDYFSATIY